MITNIESYSKFRQGEVAMYSLMDTLRKLDKNLEDNYASKELVDHVFADNRLHGKKIDVKLSRNKIDKRERAVKSEREFNEELSKALSDPKKKNDPYLKEDYDDSNKALSQKEASLESARSLHRSTVRDTAKAWQTRNEAAKAEEAKRNQYKKVRNFALAGASVAALAGLGYGAYKLIKHFKGKDDPKKIMDEIKELEKKAKDQGGLNKTDAERLAVLSKKLSKMAVKEDPANLEKVQKEVETATSKIG